MDSDDCTLRVIDAPWYALSICAKKIDFKRKKIFGLILTHFHPSGGQNFEMFLGIVKCAQTAQNELRLHYTHIFSVFGQFGHI